MGLMEKKSIRRIYDDFINKNIKVLIQDDYNDNHRLDADESGENGSDEEEQTFEDDNDIS
jgi:hypothetical protein